jgi:hypothetical protein
VRVSGAATAVESPAPAPRRRRAKERPHERLLRALRLSAWMLTTILAVAGTGVLLFLHRGDAEGSARLANAEIERALQRGEVVQRRASVMRRNWWDYFRVTHGVLAVTDRRLMYVGVPPDGLLPREPEPAELEELSFSFDRAIDTRYTRVFLGTVPGLEVQSAGRGVVFGFASRDRAKVDSVVAVVSRRTTELRTAQEAERRAAEAAIEASRRAIYHLVRRGEALEFLARRYGTTVDSLVAWNRLEGTRIKAGQRLLVRPQR